MPLSYLPALVLALSALQPVVAQQVPEGLNYIHISKAVACLSSSCKSELSTSDLGAKGVCTPNWCPTGECANWAGDENNCCVVYKHSTEKGRGADGPYPCTEFQELAESASEKDGIAATAEFCKQGGWPLYGFGPLVCCPDNYHALVYGTKLQGSTETDGWKRCIGSTVVSKKNENPKPVLTGTPITSGLAEATGSSGSSSGSGSGSSGSSGSTATGGAASSTATGASSKSAGSSTSAINAVAVLSFSLAAAVGWLQFL